VFEKNSLAGTLPLPVVFYLKIKDFEIFIYKRAYKIKITLINRDL